MGWIVANLLLGIFFVLAGIALESDRTVSAPALLAKTLERIQLAVDERVHRVDDERPNRRLAGFVSEDVVNDWQKISDAFTGAGARGDDVVMALLGDSQGFFLMAIAA